MKILQPLRLFICLSGLFLLASCGGPQNPSPQVSSPAVSPTPSATDTPAADSPDSETPESETLESNVDAPPATAPSPEPSLVADSPEAGGVAADPDSFSDYRFNPSQVTVGDRILGMEITSLEATTISDGVYYGHAQFSGETTVTGKYDPQTYLPGSIEGIPCFYVSPESNDQLPRFINDERDPWFCFTNPSDVITAFGDIEEPVDNVTMVINQFQTEYVPTDVVNQAEFVRLK